MYFEVQFKDGSKSQIDLSATHTIRVISPDDHVQDAFGLNDVADVRFHTGCPEPVAAAVAPEPDVDPEQPALPPIADVIDGAQPDPGHTDHQQAVAAAEDAVLAASVSDPAERATIAHQALTDVEAALGRWENSQPLTELKAKLEALL